MTLHSDWGGSGAYRWSRCAGSVYLSKLAPLDMGNAAADRGTRIHEAAGAVLCTAEDMSDLLAELTSEEAAVCASYVADVQTIEYDLRYVEHTFYHPTNPEIFGTVDVACIKDTTCRVGDLKSGQECVETEDNDQLLYYAWLVLLNAPRHIVDFELGIWQNGRFTWWSVSAAEVMAAGDRFMAARMQSPAQLVVGDHCIRCKAHGICGPAREVTAIVKRLDPPAALSPQKIADSMPLIKRLRDLLGAVEDQAMELGLRGALPGYKVVDGRKRPLAWNTDNINASDLGVREEDLHEAKLKSPTQIAKLCSEERLVNLGYATRPPPLKALVPVIQSETITNLTDW